MKKLSMVLLLINILLFADYMPDTRDRNVEKQCRYDLYGEGEVNYYTSGRMIGNLDMANFLIPFDKSDPDALKLTRRELMNIACEKALKNKKMQEEYGFYHTFQWYISEVIEK